MDVQFLWIELPVWPQQPVDEVPQPVRFANDDAGVLGKFLVGQFASQQLRCAAYAAERVFDFMRQTANHRAAGFLRVQQVLFATELEQPVHCHQLYQQAEGTVAIRYRSGDHIDMDLLSRYEDQGNTAAGMRAS